MSGSENPPERKAPRRNDASLRAVRTHQFARVPRGLRDRPSSDPNDGKSEAPLVSERGFINPAASYSPTEKLCSTIGSGGLDFRVRDGIGYDPSDIATETCRSVFGLSDFSTKDRAMTRVLLRNPPIPVGL